MGGMSNNIVPHTDKKVSQLKIWITPKQKLLFKQKCKELGLTMSQVLTQFIINFNMGQVKIENKNINFNVNVALAKAETKPTKIEIHNYIDVAAIIGEIELLKRKKLLNEIEYFIQHINEIYEHYKQKAIEYKRKDIDKAAKIEIAWKTKNYIQQIETLINNLAMRKAKVPKTEKDKIINLLMKLKEIEAKYNKESNKVIV